MKRTKPQASGSLFAKYEDGVLEITFKNGDVYQYSFVPDYLCRQFMASTSKLQFYNKFIKGAFVPVKTG